MDTAISQTQRSDTPIKKKKSFKQSIVYKQKYLFAMSLPIIIWLIIFAYVPIWGWVMAFFEYKLGQPFTSMEFIGLKYFNELIHDMQFWRVFKNTVIISSMSTYIASTIFPIIFALLLNEIRNITFKRTIQTVSYLPHFVSSVVVAGMVIQALSPDTGIINVLLTKMNILNDPIHFMAEPKYYYWIATISDIWKGLGWNAIIYISAIAGIDQELYEAVTVDGAGRFGRIRYVTLPGISTTIIMLLILSAGSLVSAGLDKPLLLGNALNMAKAETVDLYVLNYGIGMGRFSFGTAVGIFRSVISLVLVFTANFLSKKFTDESFI